MQIQTILFKFRVLFFLVFLLIRYAVNRFSVVLFLFLCLLFFSLFSPVSLFASLLAFHTYARAYSGIPHRRNNYYYESDPGQETTIVSSFLLVLLIPASSTTRVPRRALADPTQNPRGLFYSRLVSSHLRPVDEQQLGHSVVYTE